MIRNLPSRFQEDPVTGWLRWILFLGPTSFLDELCIHVSVLSAYVTPHPPHCHAHEELCVALSDTIEFEDVKEESGVKSIKPLARNSLLFTDSHILHTFRNTDAVQAAFLHARWNKASAPAGEESVKLQFYHSPGESDQHPATAYKGRDILEIYDGPSRYLPRIRVFSSRLAVGAAVPLHRHVHEVLMVIVSGSVEIMGRQVNAPGVSFLKTQVPHAIVNTGPAPALFHVLEFHPEA